MNIILSCFPVQMSTDTLTEQENDSCCFFAKLMKIILLSREE